MEQISIKTMRVEDILKKDSFRRAKPLPMDSPNKGGVPDYESNSNTCPIQYCYPTQDDFLREYNPESHNINSLKHYPNLFFSDGQTPSSYRAKVRSRVSIAWQRRIHTKRLVALTGYDPDITASRSRTDAKSIQTLATFKEGWASKGMDTAVHLAIKSDLKVGDAAICGYKDNGTFGYRIFAYDKGDVLYPHYDPMTGRLALFARKFKRTEVRGDLSDTIYYLDVWDTTHYTQYRSLASWERTAETNSSWVVSYDARPHMFNGVPVAYHRYGEPCWAASQSLIEQNELALSQLSENNAQYALRILYALGAEFEMEGANDGTPTQINSSDPNAKVGFLDSADKSQSYELELNTQAKEIMRCSFCVETPEIKSGSDLSSLTVKMLNADAYLKALDDAREYQSFLDDLKDIFIEGYGTEVNKGADFRSLNVCIKLQPWVFMSESEVVNTLVQLVSIGVLSKRSATEYTYETLGLGSVDEAERVLDEAHEELVREGKIQQTSSTNPVNDRRNAQNA